MDNFIKQYINDPNNSETNYALALRYDSIGQTASALSYYLRAAERTDDKLLAYECLIRGAECYMRQGTRRFTVKCMLQNAITLLPKRPEAYLKLSQIYENASSNDNTWTWAPCWFEAYTTASIALELCDFSSPSLRTDVGFRGKYQLLFQKAHTAWHCGLCDYSREAHIDLYQNYEMDDLHLNVIRNNMENLNVPSWIIDLDWGIIKDNPWFYYTLQEEIFIKKIYTKFVDINEGDIVFDIGASIGPFTHSIIGKKPSKVVCVEPHKELFPKLQKNITQDNVILFNKAIGKTNGKEEQSGLYNPIFNDHEEELNKQTVESITFMELIRQSNVDHIDFLKTDCEGGEYDIFTEENFPWIKENVKYIAGEFHLDTPYMKEKFASVYNMMKELGSYEIYDALDNNITETVDNNLDGFIKEYINFSVYIKNNNYKKYSTQDKWKFSVAPTMEFTTIIPEKGCVVDCMFCPQRTLSKVYKGERRLSLDNFKRVVDKIPQEVRITFAGFTEPWLNSDCTEMLLYAHEKGHPISAFTTLVGMQPKDIEAIRHVPFAGNPNGGFTVHLPDQERLAKHPINDNYIETVKYLHSVQHEIQDLRFMSMGLVHESIREWFSDAFIPEMWSRAGNLVGEGILKQELQQHYFKSVNHGDKDMTCGCDERLYHNVMLPNGDVALCCMDYGLEEITGNLFEQEYNDVLPEPYECFKMCRLCENAIDVNSRFIQAERKMYGV